MSRAKQSATRVGSIRILATTSVSWFAVRRCDIDPQIPLEVGHVFSNIYKVGITSQTAPPRTPVYRTKNHVLGNSHTIDEASRDDDSLQFSSIDDECLAMWTELACLVKKKKLGRLDANMNDQWQLANARAGAAAGTPGEFFTSVRIEDKCISWRQLTQATQRLAGTCRHVQTFAEQCYITGKMKSVAMTFDIENRQRSGRTLMRAVATQVASPLIHNGRA